MAPPETKGNEMKYANEPGLTELIVELRDAGVKWNTPDGIVAQIREAHPIYATDSAIPARRIYNAAKLAGTTGKGAKKKIVQLRDVKCWGWTKIADSAGISVAEAKDLYAKGGGANPDGRIYRPGGESHPGAGAAKAEVDA